MASESPCSGNQSAQSTICQICGLNMNSFGGEPGTMINYQKQIDPPICPYGDDETIQPAPIPEGFNIIVPEEPTIVHTSSIEFRVTGDVRNKPANQTGVTYIMNHGAMDRKEVEALIEKKKRMAELNQSWVGDGSYVETRPEMMHYYGRTTHLFLPNPDKPYGNSPPPIPVCKPRDGLDH